MSWQDDCDFDLNEQEIEVLEFMFETGEVTSDTKKVEIANLFVDVTSAFHEKILFPELRLRDLWKKRKLKYPHLDLYEWLIGFLATYEPITFADSVYKHGLTKSDVLTAIESVDHWKTIRKSGNINATCEMAIGYIENKDKKKKNLIEVELMSTTSYDEKSLRVFHAKPGASNEFKARLNEKKE